MALSDMSEGMKTAIATMLMATSKKIMNFLCLVIFFQPTALAMTRGRREPESMAMLDFSFDYFGLWVHATWDSKKPFKNASLF